MTGVGAVASLIANPLWGLLSDRLSLAQPRRRVVVAGVAVGAIGLALLALAQDTGGMILGWVVVQVGLNGPLAALIAMIADRVPEERRGNYYEPVRIEAPRADVDYAGTLEVDIPEGMPFAPVEYPSDERTDFGWAIVPAALTAVLVELHESYPGMPPIVVTENGASYHDVVDADGAVHDPKRIAFLDAHVRAVADAVAAGVDVQGYYVWSAFDNFEWAAGYDERFGLVYVDYATQERIRKDSWSWYRDLIAAQPRP